MTKTIADLRTDHPISTVADGFMIPMRDGSLTGASLVEETRAYMLDNASILALPGLVSLAGSVATNTAALAALSTQSSVVDVHPVGSSQSNSVSVYTDLFAANGSDTRAEGDILTYTASHALLNIATVANKTSVVITTTLTNSTITATSGTFVSTDTGRLITASTIPANTYITFVDSTHATLRDASGTAVTAGVTAGTGITTVISSPNVTYSLLFKFATVNMMQFDAVLAPAGAGTLYMADFDATFVQGVDGTHHVREAHWRITNSGVGGNTTPTSGYLYDLTWASNDGSTSVGTTRQAVEMRLTPSIASPSAVMNRHQSVLYSTRNPT